MKIVNKIIQATKYIIFLLILIILVDVLLFKRVLNLGYPSHFDQENYMRHPAPFVEFTAKPGVLEHNEFGFRGKSLKTAPENAIKIAFFGGSTGYGGNPSIAENLENELKMLTGMEIFVSNFSVVSSNHRQHLHAILEYLPVFNPDIIVFYGGYNETIQTGFYDPRPGYPYNFFFKRELSSFKKLLLENSAIIGTIDNRTGYVSGKRKLQNMEKPFSDEWNLKLKNKYFETLDLANKISRTLNSSKFGNTKFISFYQPYQVPDDFVKTHHDIKDSITKTDFIFDVSDVYLPLGKDIFRDIVHVKQPANDLMGRTIAGIIYEKHFK